jgi:hypothetical protein
MVPEVSLRTRSSARSESSDGVPTEGGTVGTMILVLVGALLALSLIIVGCGSSDSDGEAALSRAEFVLEANAICTTAVDLDPRRALGRHPSPAEFARFVRGVVVPTIQGEIDGIRSLPPPDSDEDEISAILDSAQAAIDEVEAHPGALDERPNPFRESTRLAHSYGLDACGGG